jgi:hypothetical protein
MARTIILGDIHGCCDEFKDLLDKLAVTTDDRLISVGDMICKGPFTAQVLEIAMKIKNLNCVLGNHEWRFLSCWQAGDIPNIKPYDLATVEQMGERYSDYMNYISKWPFYLDFPEALVVHAGLRPGVSLKEQKKSDLTKLRNLEPEDRPWYEFYKDPKPVVFGHWVRRDPLILKNVIGIDTGCVYGGRLSAYILPEKKIVSVTARKTYVVRENKWE